MASAGTSPKQYLFAILEKTEGLLDERIIPSSFRQHVKAIYDPLVRLEHGIDRISEPRIKDKVSKLLPKCDIFVSELRARTANSTFGYFFDELVKDAKYLQKESEGCICEASESTTQTSGPPSPTYQSTSYQPASTRPTGLGSVYTTDTLRMEELLEENARRETEIVGLQAQNEQLQRDFFNVSQELAALKETNKQRSGEAVEKKTENEKILSHVQQLHTAIANLNTIIPISDAQQNWNTLEHDLPNLIRKLDNLNTRLQDLTFTRHNKGKQLAITDNDHSPSTTPRAATRTRQSERLKDDRSGVRSPFSRASSKGPRFLTGGTQRHCQDVSESYNSDDETHRGRRRPRPNGFSV